MLIRKPNWVREVQKLVHYPKVQDMCGWPYPGHPKGCPNYNKYPDCPPNTPYVTDLFNVKASMFLVFSEFDLAGHVAKMKTKHLNWTDKQARCVLYWQPRSKKQMRERVKLFLKESNCNQWHFYSEALGVNMYATASLSGLKLERIRDLKTCHHIALVGWKC